MSARMQFPLSQRRHTNIAVVRYTRNGVKLEIACYKNKVISYRSGLEDRLDEVLQVERIFTNVGRGYVAPEKDIAAVFGPEMSEQEAIKFILLHGEVQVAQQERTAEVDEMFKDIALMITQKCVNAETQRPFPTQVIEQALRTMGAGVKLDQPVKKQALSLMHQLINSHILPLVRANMKLRCNTTSAEALEQVKLWCTKEGAEVIEVQDPRHNTAPTPGTFSVLLIAQPHLFRELDRFVKESLPEGSTLHTVDTAVTEIAEGEAGATSLRTRAATTTTCSSSVPGTSEADIVASSGLAAHQVDRRKNNNKKSKKNADMDAELGGQRTDSDEDEDTKATKKSKRTKEQKKKDKQQQQKVEEEVNKSSAHTDEATHLSSALAAVSAELQKLGLDPRTECMEADESDNEGAGGRHKAKNKKGAAAAAAGRKKRSAPPKQPEPPVKAEEPENSDEELEGNRRQRKNAKKKEEEEKAHAYNNGDDEEDFDYGEDEEEGENEAAEQQPKKKEEEGQ